jgi:hypothetical protein
LKLTYQNNSKSLDIKCRRLSFVPFHISLKPYLSMILPLSLNAMNLILARVQGDSYLVPVQFCPRLGLSCFKSNVFGSRQCAQTCFYPLWVRAVTHGLNYLEFCPVHRDTGHTIEECHTLCDVIRKKF